MIYYFFTTQYFQIYVLIIMFLKLLWRNLATRYGHFLIKWFWLMAVSRTYSKDGMLVVLRILPSSFCDINLISNLHEKQC